MSDQTTWGAWVSEKANKLAKQLITEYPIQPGYGLSLFLDVNHAFDNHVATRIWTQRMLDEGLDEFSFPIYELRILFAACLPVY